MHIPSYSYLGNDNYVKMDDIIRSFVRKYGNRTRDEYLSLLNIYDVAGSLLGRRAMAEEPFWRFYYKVIDKLEKKKSFWNEMTKTREFRMAEQVMSEYQIEYNLTAEFLYSITISNERISRKLKEGVIEDFSKGKYLNSISVDMFSSAVYQIREAEYSKKKKK